MTAAPKSSTPDRSCFQGSIQRAELVKPDVRPTLFGKKRDDSTEGTLRGRGPGECERIAEIKSGRAVSQQGLAATCKDLSYKENEIGGRDSVWRMSPDEL